MGTFLSSFLTDLIGRFDGPLHFRFFAQPLMAIVLAVRDGSRDAREGRGAYGWSLLTDPAHRRYLLESGWKGIFKVFVVAYALDVVYQVMVWHGLKPFEALLTAGSASEDLAALRRCLERIRANMRDLGKQSL